MRKYNIFIAILGMVTLAVLIGGFKLVGTPISSRQEKLDEERLADFNSIKYQIENYYREKGNLPTDLWRLSTNVRLSDPKTGKMYDYAPINETGYKLCTIFATDTWQKQFDGRVGFAGPTTGHRSGYDCISYTIPSYIRIPTPTVRPYRSPTPPVTSFCPGNLINGECVIPRNCRDSDGVNIYSRGYAAYNNPNGEGFVTVYDKCVEGANQVRENICQAEIPGAAELVWTEKIYDCPYACSNGVCVNKRIYPMTDEISPVPKIIY